MAFTNTLTARETFVPMLLGFTGDISFNGLLTSSPFSRLTGLPPDLQLVANLESPLRPPGPSLSPARANKILLSAEVAAMAWLGELPVALVCLGNNHIGDYGNEVAQFTIRNLRRRYVTFGAGLLNEPFHACIHRSNSLTLGLLSYCSADASPLSATAERIGPRLFSLHESVLDIERIRPHVDHIVVLLHWGEEHMPFPAPDQVTAARRIIDAGADLVIGSHPHVVQGYECYKGKYVFYSLGNFFFPDIFVTLGGCEYEYRFSLRNRWGLLPVFDIQASHFRLETLYIVRQESRPSVSVVQSKGLHRRVRRLSKPLALRDYAAWYARRAPYERLMAWASEFSARPQKCRIVCRKITGLLQRRPGPRRIGGSRAL